MPIDAPASTNVFRRSYLVAGIVVAVAVIGPWLAGRRQSDGRRLVLYCAHDAQFASALIEMFQAQTGITVDVRYDEEANKSLGLTSLLIAERDQPRCDVFWNNQTLGTIRLRKAGVLTPLEASAVQRIPEAFRDPGGYWCGFAARLRVWIVNTDKLTADPAAIDQQMKSDSLTTVAIANPLFGTTLTHYTVLCQQIGLDGLKAWHQSLQDRHIRVARGNAAVKDLVAEGACALGLTDSDDYFVAVDAKRPVAMLPVRTPSGKTICIPNSVAMIRNSPNPDAAREFVKFLLSESTELALAQSAARQIPLGPVDESQLPAEVRELRAAAAQSASMTEAAVCDQMVLDWLSSLDL
jgi:iron(III) transport system substrate-binding protein